ncbi:carboxypeptidase regulatory-like domain-containing protein, partial [Singulisphaera rosea]
MGGSHRSQVRRSVLLGLCVAVFWVCQAHAWEEPEVGVLSGRVVDARNRPIEGVEADAWHWKPGHVTRTDRDGRFRFEAMPKREAITIRLRKDGYATHFYLDKVSDRPEWVVVLGNSTYLEGRVLALDGMPVPRALLRAEPVPRKSAGDILPDCYTETSSGEDGRYRLYLEPGQFTIGVLAPGRGVASLREMLEYGQASAKDITLQPGIRFVAQILDSESGKPIPGVRLSHWLKPELDGMSDADGRIEIRDVPPGKYPRFQIKARGYARWWSEDCLSVWGRFQKSRDFQRNFDDLDFAVHPGMKPVTISLERGVHVKGRAIDPNGKPVAGAIVAPAMTGTGNSLTGDTRFSFRSDADGRFEMWLPASPDRDYNLVVHDGR